MTATFEFEKSVRRELLDELATAGFSPTVGELGESRLTFTKDRAWVQGEDAERDAIAAVVAAHDAGAIDAAADAAKQADTDDRGVARLSVAVLLADIARLEDTTQAMTVQVVRNHLARTDKALVALLRHLVRLGQT